MIDRGIGVNNDHDVTGPQRLVEDGVRRYGRFGGRVRDPITGVLVEKSARFRGGGLDLPDGLLHGGRCRVKTHRYLLEYDFNADTGTIAVRIDCAADKHGPANAGAVALYAEGAAPTLSISARFTSAIDYYTFKQPFPVAGTLTVGDRTYVFDQARDFVIIDENRSQFSYSTSWMWGTFAVRMAGGVVGPNFVDRAELSDDDDESSNWVPGGVEPLAGTYRGTVTSLAGESFSFDDVPGVLERMKTRF